MGIKNVGLVYTRWAHLNDRPFRVLAYMAMTALDKDDPPMYFGGWRSLALSGLGRDVEGADDHEQEATKKAVQRAVSELRKAGAITLLNTPKIGERGEYALNLNAVDQATKEGDTGGHSPSPTRTTEGDTHRTPQGDADRTPRGGHLLTEEGDAHRTPKEEPHEEQQEEHHEEQSPKVTDISSARDRARAAARASRAR